MRFDYLRNPDAIYARSFTLLREAADLSCVPQGQRPLAERLIHACALPELADRLVIEGDVLGCGQRALGLNGVILCDARMVEAGIMRSRLPQGAAVRCHLDDPRTRALAAELGTTRSAAAVELWRAELAGAVVAIGNAPTALFHLLERLSEWPERPAAILAFPVGFVGAAESKAALVEAGLGVPFATVTGRFGGSALAAAAVNAILLAG